MKLKYLAGAAVAALVFHAPATAERAPSDHVRCDGNPDNVGAGETAARVIGAITLIGLFAPAPETPDASQRLEGEAGIAVCNAALDGESNDVRRAQLILAGAIHQIEAGHHDAAIREARRVGTDRPNLVGTTPFRLSLRLAAMEIEAIALFGAGRVDEARAKALEMAAAAPYDIIAQARALRFVMLKPEIGEAEERFYANLVRLYPVAIVTRAAERQLAGDFRRAAEDHDTWLRFVATIGDAVPMSALAQAALTHALAGNVERAGVLAERARSALQSDPDAQTAAATSEVLDLYQIWDNARQGRIADARVLFANRAAWRAPSAAAVAEIARILQQGADPAQLTGALAGDPRRFVTELLERRRSEADDAKNRFAAVRGYYGASRFERFGANVWRDGRSRYFAREDNSQLRARTINVTRDGVGTPAGYAMLLHAAIVAQREGKRSFTLLPLRPAASYGAVRFGNPGEESMIEAMSFDTEQVIADLRGVIPRPAAR